MTHIPAAPEADLRDAVCKAVLDMEELTRNVFSGAVAIHQFMINVLGANLQEDEERNPTLTALYWMADQQCTLAHNLIRVYRKAESARSRHAAIMRRKREGV